MIVIITIFVCIIYLALSSILGIYYYISGKNKNSNNTYQDPTGGEYVTSVYGTDNPDTTPLSKPTTTMYTDDQGNNISSIRDRQGPNTSSSEFLTGSNRSIDVGSGYDDIRLIDQDRNETLTNLDTQGTSSSQNIDADIPYQFNTSNSRTSGINESGTRNLNTIGGTNQSSAGNSSQTTDRVHTSVMTPVETSNQTNSLGF